MKQLSTERKAPICYMTDKEKISTALQMVEEMLELAKKQDERHKAAAIAKGKAEQSVGESWEVFHLKALTDLLRNG